MRAVFFYMRAESLNWERMTKKWFLQDAEPISIIVDMLFAQREDVAIQFCFNLAPSTISVSVRMRSNNIPHSQPAARLNLDSPDRKYKSMNKNEKRSRRILVEFT